MLNQMLPQPPEQLRVCPSCKSRRVRVLLPVHALMTLLCEKCEQMWSLPSDTAYLDRLEDVEGVSG